MAPIPHPQQFRKRPVVVEAMRWQPGDLAQAGVLVGWLMRHGVKFRHPSGTGETTTLAIDTLEGTMVALPGDWIIQGTRGEFYPCKPGPFDDTFELLGEAEAQATFIGPTT